jgi:hypothetical protein
MRNRRPPTPPIVERKPQRKRIPATTSAAPIAPPPPRPAPPRSVPRDGTIRTWRDSTPKPPPPIDKAALYKAEIEAFVTRLRTSNSDVFRRQVAEQQLAVRAADESIRNMVYVQDGDQSHYRIYPHATKRARDVLGWALRLLHPTKVMGTADPQFPKRWPAWAFYNDTRR